MSALDTLQGKQPIAYASHSNDPDHEAREQLARERYFTQHPVAVTIQSKTHC